MSKNTNVHTPRSEAELAEFLGTRETPVSVQGGGTRPIGNMADHDVISTALLSGITTYEPGALTLVAAAGTPIEEINRTLAAENQRLAFEPVDYRGLLGAGKSPTLGGVIASNSSGPRRIQVGAARDFTLGVRFVDGIGKVLKNGGRVMKNVTGYDLVKLLAGSWGTLGVLTEVSLKVLPIAEAVGTVAVSVPNAERAVEVMSTALKSPYDVSGAAYENGTAHIRVEGFEKSVGYRVEELKELLAPLGTALDTSSDAHVWNDIRDAKRFHGQEGDIWRISVKPTDGPRVIAALDGDTFMDWGGGLAWARVPEGTDVRKKLGHVRGHATQVRGHTTPAFEPQAPVLKSISQGIKAKFDPKNILNPGRLM